MKKLADLNCVVLGAAGFIGRNLSMHLAGRVRHLRTFARQNFPWDRASGVECVDGDFGDAQAVRSAVAGCDVVFHLINATNPASANENKILDANANIINTIQMLEVCREEKVGRIVFTSSGGTVYGIPSVVPTSETSSTRPITAYGISKLAIENYLHLFNYLYGLEYRILRISNPFGPYQTSSKSQGVIAAFLERALAGKPVDVWGDGTVQRDYVYIDDVSTALELAAVHSGPSTLFNIGSGRARSINNLISEIRESLGINVEARFHAGRSVDVPISVLDNGLARSELGWVPKTDFSKGLESTLAWIRENTAP
jgi:UDP-glucose 4-epimerase